MGGFTLGISHHKENGIFQDKYLKILSPPYQGSITCFLFNNYLAADVDQERDYTGKDLVWCTLAFEGDFNIEHDLPNPDVTHH
jgi:hypothetical protein